MAQTLILVVHPFRDRTADFDASAIKFSEFKAWRDMTVEERAEALESQAPHDYWLTDRKFVVEAGNPPCWDDYTDDQFVPHGLEPLGMCKVSTETIDDPNFNDYWNPVFKKID